MHFSSTLNRTFRDIINSCLKRHFAYNLGINGLWLAMDRLIAFNSCEASNAMEVFDYSGHRHMWHGYVLFCKY